MMTFDETEKSIIGIICGLSLIFLCLFFLVLSSGCVTASKDLYREITATPAPTPTPTPEPTPEPTPTPEPEVIASFGDALRPYQYIDWRRDNVSGLKDLSQHATIYGYREFTSIEWWSVSWGKYFTQTPAEGQKYLFVFVNMYSDENAARTWGLRPYQWDLHNTKSRAVYNITADLLPEYRIKELDETWDLQHKQTIQPYGYLRTYSNTGKPSVEELGFIKAGKSNAWDGYIVYSVPKDTDTGDLVICAPLTNTLNGCWRLQ